MKTVKEWAELLNGREYGEEITSEEAKKAAADGVIVAFGASDDLLEFSGAIDDEYSAWEGVEAKVYRTPDGKPELFNDDLVDEAREDELELTNAQIAKMLIVKAVWCPPELKTSWLIETAIPHEKFDIMEEGALYCRGLVFSVNDVPIV